MENLPVGVAVEPSRHKDLLGLVATPTACSSCSAAVMSMVNASLTSSPSLNRSRTCRSASATISTSLLDRLHTTDALGRLTSGTGTLHCIIC